MVEYLLSSSPTAAPGDANQLEARMRGMALVVSARGEISRSGGGDMISRRWRIGFGGLQEEGLKCEGYRDAVGSDGIREGRAQSAGGSGVEYVNL